MSGPYRNPAPTVDIIIEMPDGRIVLIRRKNPPLGWALPGGFVDYGEPLWETAVREAREETSLEVELTEQFHTYSDPARDPRQHTVATVYLARAQGRPEAAGDAAEVGLYSPWELPELCFDHAEMMADYLRYKETGKRPCKT